MDRLFVYSLKNYYQKRDGHQSKLQKPDSRKKESTFLNVLAEYRTLKISRGRK